MSGLDFIIEYYYQGIKHETKANVTIEIFNETG